MYQPIIEFIDREIKRLQQARSILAGTKSLPYEPYGEILLFKDTGTNPPIPPNGESIQVEWPPLVAVPGKGRKRWSEEARKAHSERLRERWRKRKADESRAAKKSSKK